MGNPLIVDGDKPPSVELSETKYRDNVYSIVFDGSGRTPVHTNCGDRKSLEQIVFDKPFVMLEQLGYIVEEEQDLDGLTVKTPLVYRPPFISEQAWLTTDDNTARQKGVSSNSSFGMLKEGFLTPYALVPDCLLTSNSGIDGGGVWQWKLSDATVTDTTKYFEVVNDSSYSHKSITAKNEACLKNGTISFVLNLDDDRYTNFNKTGVDVLKGTGKNNKLGSFTLLINDLKPVHDFTSTDETSSFSVLIKIGDNITASLEKNSVLKVNVYGYMTEVQLPSPSSVTQTKSTTSDKGGVSLSFIPVFNGVLVVTGLTQGTSPDQKNVMTAFCKKKPEITDIYNYAANQFDIDDPKDVELELKDDVLVEVGNKLDIGLRGCTATFAYMPLFFSPESLGYYYFNADAETSATDNSSGTDVVKVYHRLLPVWCRNNTAASLYPFDYGSTERYPKNYPTRSKEIPQAVTIEVDIKREIGVSRVVRRETTADPGSSSGTKWVLDFYIKSTNLVSAGEKIKVEGDYAGSYNVVNSESNVVTCSTSQTGALDETVTDCTIMINDPDFQAKKITFGVCAGEQEKVSGTETDAAALVRFGKSTYVRFPPQLYGFLIVRSEKVSYDIDNEVGDDVSFGTDWKDYIKNISITHNESGTSGSMTVDRYGLCQFVRDYEANILKQQVGGLNLDVVFCNTSVDDDSVPKSYAVNLSTRPNEGGSSLSYSSTTKKIPSDLLSSFYKTNRGILLRGIAYGQGISDSADSNNLEVPVYGLQKKLEDIKLVNAPFFDGKKLSDTLEFMAEWGNIAMNLENADGDARMPSSQVLSAVKNEFKTGTSVWDALQTIAEETGHSFVLQPDGVLWWYKISDVNGIPNAVAYHTRWSYPNTRVVSSSASPDLSQFYNQIILMAYQANGAGVTNPLQNPDDIPIVPLIAGAKVDETNPKINWSRLAVIPLNSYWTESELAAQARKYVVRAQAILWSGSTTIPGNLAIKLYDTFTNGKQSNSWSLSGDYLDAVNGFTTTYTSSAEYGSENFGDFLITGITHNVDMMSRSVTTSLQLSMLGNCLIDKG